MDGKALPSPERKVYIILNKPRGVVSTAEDEQGRRKVTDLLEGLPERVYPVGRLDLDSEGLLLLTNDGDFANRLAHPSHEVEKCYRTWVRGEEPEEAIRRLRLPMELDGHPLRPARVSVREQGEDSAVLEITIHEGRNRQVRRMCEQAGLRVERLCRIREGELRLGGLRPGQWRFLTEEEKKMLEGKP